MRWGTSDIWHYREQSSFIRHQLWITQQQQHLNNSFVVCLWMWHMLSLTLCQNKTKWTFTLTVTLCMHKEPPPKIDIPHGKFPNHFFGGENSVSQQRQTFITIWAPERNVSVRCAKTAEGRTFFTVLLYAIAHDTTEVQKNWLLHFPHGRKTKHATSTDKFSLVGSSTTP